MLNDFCKTLPSYVWQGSKYASVIVRTYLKIFKSTNFKSQTQVLPG